MGTIDVEPDGEAGLLENQQVRPAVAVDIGNVELHYTQSLVRRMGGDVLQRPIDVLEGHDFDLVVLSEQTAMSVQPSPSRSAALPHLELVSVLNGLPATSTKRPPMFWNSRFGLPTSEGA